MQVDELIRIGRTLHDRVLRGDPALLHPSAQSSWTRSLAEALIGVFEALGDLSVPSYADARSAHRHVDRAHDFMLEHYADIAMMAEVADACGISSRTLEAAFRTVWGVRPLQLLASIRLDAVRRDLMDADPTASVNDLALGAGFSHLGRFSLLYRERYGEHPSDTIRRARGA
jgi:transcriptional regulator GlxA family with amidase domain